MALPTGLLRCQSSFPNSALPRFVPVIDTERDGREGNPHGPIQKLAQRIANGDADYDGLCHRAASCVGVARTQSAIPDARSAVMALLRAICEVADKSDPPASFWINDGADFRPIPELGVGLLSLKVPSELRVVLSLIDAQKLAFRILEQQQDQN